MKKPDNKKNSKNKKVDNEKQEEKPYDPQERFIGEIGSYEIMTDEEMKKRGIKAWRPE